MTDAHIFDMARDYSDMKDIQDTVEIERVIKPLYNFKAREAGR